MNKHLLTPSMEVSTAIILLHRHLRAMMAIVLFFFAAQATLNAQCQTCCNGSKPKTIVFLYNGVSCSGSNTCQAADKWSCSGSGPNNAASVYITASKNVDGSGGTYFAGTVALNEQFTANASAGGSTTFPANTYFRIFSSQGGTLLQTVKNHTSCSTPLVAGDQMGALKMIQIILADNTVCNAPTPPPQPETCPKPTSATVTQGNLTINVAPPVNGSITDLKISASANDSYQTSDGKNKPNNYESGEIRFKGFRFPDLNIPAGAVITSAQLKLVGYKYGNVQVAVKAENLKAPSAFTNANNYLSSRSVTAASANWSIPSLSNGTQLTSPDLSAVVQQVVNAQNGITHLSLILSNPSGKWETWNFDDGSSNSAKFPVLNLTYTVPSNSSNQGVCALQPVTFSTQDLGYPCLQYDWNFGSNATPSTATGLGPISVVFSSAGTANVSLTAKNNCSNTEPPSFPPVVFGCCNQDERGEHDHPHKLILEYVGSGSPTVTFRATDNGPFTFFSGQVSNGTIFTVDGTGHTDKHGELNRLDTDTEFQIGSSSNQEVHTSCSQDISPGYGISSNGDLIPNGTSSNSVFIVRGIVLLNTGSGTSIYCQEGNTSGAGGGTTVCGSTCFNCEETINFPINIIDCVCANQGGDTDGDGVCNNQDCAPNNPNLPTTPGTACNDNNPNTTNDVIQADGCSCAGTPLQVDLELTKSVNKSIVETGETALWTISVINKGPAAATNVTVRDNFPAGLTYNSANASQGSFNVGTLTWDIGNLAVNQTVTLTINTAVTATSGTIRNFAQIQTANPNDIDSTPGNDTNQTVNEDDEDDAIITVQPCVNQGGDTDGDGVCNNQDCAPNNPNLPTAPGTACNDNNPNTTNDVIQADGCSCAGTPLLCNLSATFTVPNGCLTNSFLLFADANDPYFPPTNPLYTYSYTIQPQSSVASLTSIDPRSVTVTFNSPGVKTVTATITNPAIPNCQIVKTATFTVSDCSPCAGQGGDTDGDGVCNNQDCQPNNPAFPTTPGTACNDGNPNTTNDVVQADGCSCAGTPVATNVDLELTKSVDVSTVVTGQTAVWTISVVNKGPANATGVTVKDAFPAGLTYVSANPSQGSFNVGTLTWTIGSLAVNQTVTMTINTTVTATSGTIRNFAQVQTASPNDVDSTPGNDTNQTVNEDDEDDATINVQQPTLVDLELTKSVNASTVTTGQTVVWTISVINKGPAAATGVTVKDAFPAGLTYVSANPSQGSFNVGTLTWTIGSLAVNQTVTMTINTTVTATSGTIRNFAQVQTASPNDVDSTPGNDTNQTVNEDDEDDATINVGGGTPDCVNGISITTGNGSITVSGLNGSPVSSVQVFTATWQSVFSCFANCNGTETISVPAGTYLVYAKYYTAGYSLICEKQATVTVGGGGVCENVTNGGTIGFGTSCNGSTTYCPNQGAAPSINNCVAPSGGAGNLEIVWLKSTTSCTAPTTTAEQIAQGLDPHWTMIPGATALNYMPSNVTQQTCFLRCARRAGCPTFIESNIVTLGISSNCGGGGGGTPNCANISISTGPGSITVAGLNGAPVTSVQIFSATWQPEHNCFANCQSPTATFAVTAGAHYVYVKYYTASYQLICEVNQTVNVMNAVGAYQGEDFEFEALKQEEHTEIYWIHNGGHHVERYILQRSADGENFEQINEHNSEGGQRPELYQDFDIEPLTGDNYYRVKMVNIDGTEHYSDLQKVHFEDLVDYTIFPNPANDFAKINLEAVLGKQDVSITIFNNLGVEMKRFELEEVWSKYYQMDLRDLREGHYIVWLNAPNRRPIAMTLVIGKI